VKQSVVARELARTGVSSRESLARQSVSARPLAILPILLGSIATGSRSDTPPRRALSEFRLGVSERRMNTNATRSRSHTLSRPLEHSAAAHNRPLPRDPRRDLLRDSAGMSDPSEARARVSQLRL